MSEADTLLKLYLELSEVVPKGTKTKREIELERLLAANIKRFNKLGRRMYWPARQKFVVDNGTGDLRSFGTIQDARHCANEWIKALRPQAAIVYGGAVSARVDRIRIFVEIERATPCGATGVGGVSIQLDRTPIDEDQNDE